MADEIDTGRVIGKASFQVHESGKIQKKTVKQATHERLCFIITKNKSNSWADDLYACGHIADLNRIYH
ncbi:MAG: hypothetical protein V2B20_08130 [Pseudomonadota bacterium]